MDEQNPAQLQARIAELERELADAKAGLVRVGELTLNFLYRTAEVNGRRIALLPREFAMLLALAARPGEVISKPDLLATILETQKQKSNALAVHIHRLRAKLENSGLEIGNEPGAGYRLSIVSKRQPLKPAASRQRSRGQMLPDDAASSPKATSAATEAKSTVPSTRRRRPSPDSA